MASHMLTVFVRYAYIEFQDKEAVENAILLDQSDFRDRKLKVR